MVDLNMEYKVKGIYESPNFEGYVEVFLDPVDKSIFKRNHEAEKPNIVFSGNPELLPVGNPEQMLDMVFKQLPRHIKIPPSEDKDPRAIIFIEDIIDFQSRGWHYGDIVQVDFTKIIKK